MQANTPSRSPAQAQSDAHSLIRCSRDDDGSVYFYLLPLTCRLFLPVCKILNVSVIKKKYGHHCFSFEYAGHMLGHMDLAQTHLFSRQDMAN